MVRGWRVGLCNPLIWSGGDEWGCATPFESASAVVKEVYSWNFFFNCLLKQIVINITFSKVFAFLTSPFLYSLSLFVFRIPFSSYLLSLFSFGLIFFAPHQCTLYTIISSWKKSDYKFLNIMWVKLFDIEVLYLTVVRSWRERLPTGQPTAMINLYLKHWCMRVDQ